MLERVKQPLKLIKEVWVKPDLLEDAEPDESMDYIWV